MNRAPSPPKLTRALLRLVLPAEVRDGAVDELDEKFFWYASTAMGPRGARRWYRQQVAGVLHPRFWTRSFGGGVGLPTPPPDRRTGLSFNAMQDVRFGARMLAANPILTAIIVITLAVGLGFNGAIFSLVNTIILNDIPIEEVDQVLVVDNSNLPQGRRSVGMSYLDYQDYRLNQSFGSFASWFSVTANLSDGAGVPERYVGLAVEPSMFDVLSVEPILGRRIETADMQEGAEAVMLVGHALWQSRFGADEQIVGRVVQVDSRPTTVIGVLPPELELTPFFPDLWRPHRLTEDAKSDRQRRFLQVAGRLADGVSRDQAEAEMNQIAARLASEHRETNEGIAAVVGNFHEFAEEGNRAIVLILMVAVGFLLLIACANVANLLISRSLQRGREVAIRAALGAGRWRIVRQLLIESLMLSAMAGAAAILLTLWGTATLHQAVMVASPPAFWDFSVKPSVYLFVMGLAVATTVVFGLVPALHATRGDVRDSLKDGDRGSGGRGTRRITGALVVAQIAFSLVLLAGAGVMVRSTLNILDVEWAVDPADVLTFRLSVPSATWPEREGIVDFHQQLAPRLQSLPGVDAVSLTSDFPSDNGFTVTAEIEGRPVSDGNLAATLSQLIVSPEYFELADVQPLRGRLLEDSDGINDPLVVVIERRLAEIHWPDEDPLGKRLRWVGEIEDRWVEVVGVIPDQTQSLQVGVFGENHPIVYTPFEQEAIRTIGLMVRSSADPETVSGLVRESVQAVDANLPLFDIAPLEDVIYERSFGFRIVSVLFIMLGGIALFLACIGIYSVMAFAVGARQREIGIRMALGARTGEIIGLVGRTSMVQMAIGLALGLVGAYFMTQVLGSFMYEVSTTDPVTFIAVVVVLAITAVVAAAVPARRASRVDPLEALRGE